MIDVSLVILIALLTSALDDLAFNSTPYSVEIRLRKNAPELVIYIPKSKKKFWGGTQ